MHVFWETASNYRGFPKIFQDKRRFRNGTRTTVRGRAIMPLLSQNLVIDRCLHCSIAGPNLFKQHHLETRDHMGQNLRTWYIYTCGRCSGIITAWAKSHGAEVMGYYPAPRTVKDDVPERPRTYLQQAFEVFMRRLVL